MGGCGGVEEFGVGKRVIGSLWKWGVRNVRWPGDASFLDASTLFRCVYSIRGLVRPSDRPSVRHAFFLSRKSDKNSLKTSCN